jgi:hypothetical protein
LSSVEPTCRTIRSAFSCDFAGASSDPVGGTIHEALAGAEAARVVLAGVVKQMEAR